MSAIQLGLGKKSKTAIRAVKKTGTSDFSSQDFSGDHDFRLTFVLIQKPSASVITCHLVVNADGMDVEVLLFTSGDGVTSGVYMDNRTIEVPAGAYLRFSSTGGEDGTKKICVAGKRVDS